MLTYKLIERIVQKETSKEDIIVLRNAFGSDRLGRDAIILLIFLFFLILEPCYLILLA